MGKENIEPPLIQENARIVARMQIKKEKHKHLYVLSVSPKSIDAGQLNSVRDNLIPQGMT